MQEEVEEVGTDHTPLEDQEDGVDLHVAALVAALVVGTIHIILSCLYMM